jgi:hypothetical protein
VPNVALRVQQQPASEVRRMASGALLLEFCR